MLNKDRAMFDRDLRPATRHASDCIDLSSTRRSAIQPGREARQRRILTQKESWPARHAPHWTQIRLHRRCEERCARGRDSRGVARGPSATLTISSPARRPPIASKTGNRCRDLALSANTGCSNRNDEFLLSAAERHGRFARPTQLSEHRRERLAHRARDGPGIGLLLRRTKR